LLNQIENNINADDITISAQLFDDDGDGATNVEELVLGTNPKNAAPTIVSNDTVTVLENSVKV